jgi:hypothetical protein
MPYQLTIHGRWDGNFPRFAFFPVRDADILEIENQFEFTALYISVKIPNCSLKKRSRDLSKLPFFQGTCCLDDLIRRTKDFIQPRVILI